MKDFRKLISPNKKLNYSIVVLTGLVMLFGIVSLFSFQPSVQAQSASSESTSKKPRVVVDPTPSSLSVRDQELADKTAHQNQQLKFSLPSEFDLLKAQAPALTQMLSGTVAANSPTFNRSLAFAQGGTCTTSGVGTAVHYKAVPFTLSCMSNVMLSLLASDGATITPSTADTFIMLYGPGGFNPANACANAIAANDDAGGGLLSKISTTTPLAPGNYTLVVTTFDNEPINAAALPYNFSAVEIDTCSGGGGGSGCTPSPNIIQDGGFETNDDAGNNFFWNSTSTAFGTSLCTIAGCGTGNGTAVPRTGNGWTWFDGTGDGTTAEVGTVSQSVTIPTGATATLNYYLRVGAVTAPSTSTLQVKVDGMTVQTITEPATAEADYTLRTVNLSAFANGASHVVSFNYNRPAGTTGSDNFTIDDVSLVIACAAPTGADLTITDVDTPDTVSPGNVLLYTYLLTNKGPAAANNVTFTTAIPANTTYNLFLQSLDPGFTCTTPAVGGTGSVTCTIASLPVGTVQFKLRVIVNPGTPTDTIITNRADVTLMQTDPTPLDNIATTITRVGAATGGGGTPTGPCLTKMLDYNGDRRADYAVFRPSNNFTYVNPSSETSNLAFTGQPFGDSATDILTPGDYDGDGKTDIAVWRSTNGTFYVIRSSDNTVTAMQYGLPGDEPVARDYDGDCKTDFAVVRRVGDAKIWFIFGSATNTSRGEQFGLANDVAAPGDYDGDGKYDLAVFRGTGDNPATFFVKQSSNNGVTGRQFGLASDLVVPGDYDGDGKTDFAVARPGTSIQWFILRSSDNTVTGAALGAMPDLPTQADYDGDGKTDISVYRQQIGTFFVRRSLDGVTTQRQFGSNGDLPVASFDTH